MGIGHPLGNKSFRMTKTMRRAVSFRWTDDIVKIAGSQRRRFKIIIPENLRGGLSSRLIQMMMMTISFEVQAKNTNQIALQRFKVMPHLCLHAEYENSHTSALTYPMSVACHACEGALTCKAALRFFRRAVMTA